MNKIETKPATLSRRVGAMLYDGIIVYALMVIASAIVVFATQGIEIAPDSLYFQLYLIGIAYLYFTLSWTYKQQTIGMRAWDLYIHDNAGNPPNLFQSGLRFAYAIPTLLFLGLGLWWSLFNSRKRTLYGIWSSTELYFQPKASNTSSHSS